MDTRAKYLRPLKVSLMVAMLGELGLFLIYGVYLNPEGNLLYKFLWTVLFCGVGMGASLGAFINLFVTDKLSGSKAIMATTVLSFMILGIACDMLCISLDQHFHYFGGDKSPLIFWTGGLAGSLIGGVLIGWLCFSAKGNMVLDKLKL